MIIYIIMFWQLYSKIGPEIISIFQILKKNFNKNIVYFKKSYINNIFLTNLAKLLILNELSFFKCLKYFNYSITKVFLKKSIAKNTNFVRSINVKFLINLNFLQLCNSFKQFFS